MAQNIKTNRNSIDSKTHDLIQTDFNLQNLKSKSLYVTVLFLRYPVYQQRKRNITPLLSTYTSQLDWENIYLLSFKMTLDTKLREFQLTNRFHIAVHLFSNRSQMTSKCGKNKKVAHEAIAECVTDVLITF